MQTFEIHDGNIKNYVGGGGQEQDSSLENWIDPQLHASVWNTGHNHDKV